MDDDYDFEDDWGRHQDNSELPQVAVLAYYSLEETRSAVAEMLEELRLTFAETDDEYGLGGESFSADKVHIDLTVDAQLDCRIVFTPLINGELLSHFSIGNDHSLLVLARDKYGLVAFEHMQQLFDYLLDDLATVSYHINWDQMAQTFAEGDRALQVLNREGMEVALPYARGEW